MLPSMAIYRQDGRPIAWALLGPDSSLSNLHCEEEWRGRGFAKAVAVKLFRERLKEFDDDGYCWANVAPDNPGSQRVCKSLGGKVAWSVSWLVLTRHICIAIQIFYSLYLYYSSMILIGI